MKQKSLKKKTPTPIPPPKPFLQYRAAGFERAGSCGMRGNCPAVVTVRRFSHSSIVTSARGQLEWV